MQDARVPESEKSSPDWSIIEADYRAGIKSLRQIAGEQNVSEGAIRKRAKKEEWARDLNAKIQAKAEALVRMEAVRSEVREKNRVPESVVVEANANAVYRVQMAHRAGLSKLSTLRDSLLLELEGAASPDQKVDPPPPGTVTQIDAAAGLALPVRIESLKKLAEVDEKIRRGEREAYGIDKIQPDEGGIVSKLSDAERASRAASLLALALQRRTAETPGAA
ncbi:hypothetical protein J2W32_004454 [Variovorax boronicumulans]|uniref:Uncharacterized protein n=1 Tax=Variovorax boronicumulans TaxID=436515 RepID=A0AAW8D1K8_9BURK|nr:hypothetical protein [Variovorax boronicumulans]MDP9895356.1 hypothetical protein [Variovorax boronicumulans]MDQ0055396.1 hypothetical protein [Variovorax boronicumulans]